MTEYEGVMVYCEASDNKLSRMAMELIGIGSFLADKLGQKLIAVIIGSEIRKLANEAIAYGADKVYIVEDPLLSDYLTDSYLMVMIKIIKQAMPSIVLLGQTDVGRDLAPRLAFRLNTIATMDCVSLEIDLSNGRLLRTKPVYGGNALEVQLCESDPQIATVRRNMMAPLEKDNSRQGEIIKLAADIDWASVGTKLIDRREEMAAGIKLEDAKVIVTGGRGIGGPNGFIQLEELARVLKGAVGASRPPCSSKWVPDNLQIGITGKIVSPELYIAVGISGSTQHLSGCLESKVIVAINSDPESDIFKVSHYGIVADWKRALPVFTMELKELLAEDYHNI
ncbi:MAG: electron transfer flavoprotein subunit alpha/FixB family protein [Deltaproteobacteria bacterium]|nr:electron transfer flavoprotein subunit alpha/FixB family protein [Deltaproteobacteria bacterium]